MDSALGKAVYLAKVARHVKPVVVNTPELQLMLEIQKRDQLIEQLHSANENLTYRIRTMKIVHEDLVREISELKKSMFKMASLRRIPLNVTGSVPEAAEASGVNRGPTIAAVMAAVADRFGVSVVDILSDRRGPVVVRARQAATYLCYKITMRSTSQIGRAMSRDHTTVFYSVRRIEGNRKADAILDRNITEIERQFKHDAVPPSESASSVPAQASSPGSVCAGQPFPTQEEIDEWSRRGLPLVAAE